MWGLQEPELQTFRSRPWRFKFRFFGWVAGWPSRGWERTHQLAWNCPHCPHGPLTESEKREAHVGARPPANHMGSKVPFSPLIPGWAGMGQDNLQGPVRCPWEGIRKLLSLPYQREAPRTTSHFSPQSL